jgi:hypothetical protein
MSAFRIEWGAVSVVLSGVRGTVAEDLAADLALAPPVPEVEGQCDITVGDPSIGATLVEFGSKRYAVSSTVELSILLNTLVPALLLERAGVARRMHAAGVRVGDGILLLSGEGRIGKSSLALEAWRRGFELLGDDWLLFSDNFSGVLPVPKPLKARMTPAQFEALTLPAGRASARFGTLFGETRVLIGREYGFYNSWDQPLPVRSLVFLSGRDAPVPALERIVMAEALPLILSQTILCGNSKTLGGVAFARALADRDVPVFRCLRAAALPHELLDVILEAVAPWHQASQISPASRSS